MSDDDDTPMSDYKCEVCGDRFELEVEEGLEASTEVFLRLTHDHHSDPPYWHGAIYKHRSRFEGRKDVERIAQEQKREALETRRKKKVGVNAETEAKVQQYKEWAEENL
jgi:hypothetical protein